jgi:ATP-dependent Lon protease
VDAELDRLSKTDPAVAEYSIAFNYAECLLSLPWQAQTQDNLDLARAEAVLDGSHAGLGQVKDRVLEHLASRTMRATRAATVLVVDDEPLARANLQHILSREATGGSGGQRPGGPGQGPALGFDLIVTDLKWSTWTAPAPGTGQEVSRPPIMIVTGFATVDTRYQPEDRAVHYLSKPSRSTNCARRCADPQEQTASFARARPSFASGPTAVGKPRGMAVAEAMVGSSRACPWPTCATRPNCAGTRTYVGPCRPHHSGHPQHWRAPTRVHARTRWTRSART